MLLCFFLKSTKFSASTCKTILRFVFASRLNVFNTVPIISQIHSQEEFGDVCARVLSKTMIMLVRPLPKVLIEMIASGKFGLTNSSNSKSSMAIVSSPESKTIGRDMNSFGFGRFSFDSSMYVASPNAFRSALSGFNSLGIWVQKQRKFFRERQAGKTSNILTSEKVVSILCWRNSFLYATVVIFEFGSDTAQTKNFNVSLHSSSPERTGAAKFNWIYLGGLPRDEIRET